MQQVGYRLQIRRMIVSRQRRGTNEHLIELRIGETERQHGRPRTCVGNRSTVAQELTRRSTVVSSAYSWLPGTGLNLMPRSAKPFGWDDDALMVTAVQMILSEVAAMAAVPWLTAPVLKTWSSV